MDKYFLEFWGNFLLSAARGQEQFKDLSNWMQQGFRGYEELTKLFQKAYGLDRSAEGTPDYLRAWVNAQEDFKRSFNGYLALLGVVPRDEHLALIRKYEELKEKVASQEETIRHLRILLAEAKGLDNEGAAQHIDSLIKRQGEQFQKLMDSFRQFVSTGDTTGATGGTNENK